MTAVDKVALFKKTSGLRKLGIQTVGITLLSFADISYAFNIKECNIQAKTALEKAYCQVMEKEANAYLPNFSEFKNNPPQTQRLLLVAPARKHSIPLPKVSTQQPAKSKELSAPAKTQNSKQATTKYPNANKRQETSNTNLNSCQLIQDRVLCGSEQYYLSINIPIKHLDRRVLADANVLEMRNIGGSETTLQYLSSLYPQYIEKMLLIGLGDSTLSFTKFVGLYDASLTQKESFSQRFKNMYELLKSERKKLAVKTRYQNNFPENIDSCMRLNADIITCDNVRQNWVYKRVRS